MSRHTERGQQDIFAVDELADSTALATVEDSAPTLLFLSDLTLSHDSHVEDIPITLPDKHGHPVQTTRPGKVLHRMAPHPHYQTLKEKGQQKVMHVDQLRKLGIKGEAIMVRQVNTILYTLGVLQPGHDTIFDAFLRLWHQRWLATRNDSPKIMVTYAELAREVNQGLNGRFYKFVDEAVNALGGLFVQRHYMRPKDPSLADQVEEASPRLYGLISASDTAKGVSTGGRRPNGIAITLNPELTNALRGGSSERPWIVANYNYTRNLAYSGQRWRAQLHKVIEVRLASRHRKSMRIPLLELWVECLGCERSIQDDAPKWRKYRWKIWKCLREWMEIGYLRDVQLVARNNIYFKYGHTFKDEADGEKGEKVVIPIDFGSAKKGTMSLKLVDELLEQAEELYCERGPNFWSGKPQRTPEAAATVLKASGVPQDAIAKLVKHFGEEHILNIGRGHQRSIIYEMGDREDRTTTAGWLASSVPIPTAHHAVHSIVIEEQRRDQHRSRGELFKPPPADHADLREHIVTALITEKVRSLEMPYEVFYEERNTPEEPQLREIHMCFRLAVDRTLREKQISVDVVDEHTRLNKPEVARQFAEICAEAMPIAAAAAGVRLWLESLQKDVVKRLGKPDTLSAVSGRLPADLENKIRSFFPGASNIVFELTRPNSHPWEVQMGHLFRLRLVERIIEGEKLELLRSKASRTSATSAVIP